MFETLTERIRKVRSIFGKEDTNDVNVVEPINLEQERIEVLEVDENGAVLTSSVQGYSAEEKIHSVRLAIEKYREMSKHSEIEEAIQEITDEAIVKDVDGKIIQLDLSGVDDEILNDDMKDRIHTQFDRIISLLRFNQKAEQLFRQWYIDGRAYFQVYMNDAENGGLIGIRLLNPKFLTKVVIKDKESGKNAFYYYYKPELDVSNIGFTSDRDRSEPALIPEDHIIFIPSGFIDYGTDMYISYLHKAIKPFNNLRDIEDSAIIYRLTRSTERRVIKVDVSKLPPSKADAYMQNVMRKWQNKMVYNSTTGTMDQRKNTVSMIEDFYIPVNADGKGADITNLPGGAQLGEMADIQYFYQKLLKSLKVPFSRFDSANKSFIDFSRGAGDIDREELRFSKFINKLREQFALLLYELLKRQLIAKKILDKNDWTKIEQFILFDWSRDMHYEAVKYREEVKAKLEILASADGYVGKYITKAWIYYNVFDMNDEEIREMEKDLATEAETGEAAVPEDPDADPNSLIGDEPLAPEPPPEEPGPAEEDQPEPEPLAASISKSKKKTVDIKKKKKEIMLFGSLLDQRDK